MARPGFKLPSAFLGNFLVLIISMGCWGAQGWDRFNLNSRKKTGQNQACLLGKENET